MWRIGWLGSRLISLGGSLQDSTSTFLEAREDNELGVVLLPDVYII